MRPRVRAPEARLAWSNLSDPSGPGRVPVNPSLPPPLLPSPNPALSLPDLGLGQVVRAAPTAQARRSATGQVQHVDGSSHQLTLTRVSSAVAASADGVPRIDARRNPFPLGPRDGRGRLRLPLRQYLVNYGVQLLGLGGHAHRHRHSRRTCQTNTRRAARTANCCWSSVLVWASFSIFIMSFRRASFKSRCSCALSLRSAFLRGQGE